MSIVIPNDDEPCARYKAYTFQTEASSIDELKEKCKSITGPLRVIDRDFKHEFHRDAKGVWTKWNMWTKLYLHAPSLE